MKKKMVCILLSLIMSMLVVDPIWATTISDINKEKKETQNRLDAINGQIGNLQGKQSGIKSQINELDSSLVETLASISMIEDEIEIKQDEITAAEEEYEKAKKQEEDQYEAMKIRIQFMYETGNTAYMEALLQAKSISDMLNKADYIEQIYDYDRKLLKEYQEIKQKVADLQEQLEIEKSELLASQHELEEEKNALNTALEAKKAESKNYEVQLAKAKQDAAAYKLMIKQQNAKIKQLEAEAAKKNKPQSTGSGVYRVDASIVTNATGSALGKEIATYALKFQGNPYVPGGTSLTNGADCSGFTYAVYQAFGYRIPRDSTSQRSAGKGVEYSQAEPGDLICYAGHVGLYIGGGKIVHASTQKTGIKVSNATYKPILGVRRIV